MPYQNKIAKFALVNRSNVLARHSGKGRHIYIKALLTLWF